MSPTDDERQVVANRLREAREFLNFTQEDVAQALGYARTTVTAIEAGRRNVSTLELKRFSKLYNRSLDWLAGGDAPVDVTAAMRCFARFDELSDSDQEQVRRFIEFLATATERPPV
jgi:transcriptional regulator with XRE-family HTH domain